MACAWTQDKHPWLWNARLLHTQGEENKRTITFRPFTRTVFQADCFPSLWTLVPLMLLLLLNYSSGGRQWENKAELYLFTEKICMFRLSSLVQIMAGLGLGGKKKKKPEATCIVILLTHSCIWLAAAFCFTLGHVCFAMFKTWAGGGRDYATDSPAVSPVAANWSAAGDLQSTFNILDSLFW